MPKARDDKKQLISLSYSTWTMYRACPARYKAYTVDFKDLPPATDNEIYNFTFGNVMHDVAEFFYKNKLYLECKSLAAVKDVYLKIKARLQEFFDKRAGNITLGVKFRPHTKDEFLARIERGSKRFLAAVVRDRLFGTYTGSEVDLKLRLADQGLALFGKIDLAVVKRQEGKIIILDFKSRPNETVDQAQLDWYALLWYLKFGYYPTEIGFFYFEGDREYDKIPVVPDRVEALYSNILLIRDRIASDKKFAPVQNERCWSCKLKNTCLESPYSAKQRAVADAKQIEGDIVPFGGANLPDELRGIFE